jgi:recombination protein RecA
MPRAKAAAPEPEEIVHSSVEFFSSGSTLLNLVLGAGWAEGRVINIVGDRSAGKTLMAIEACANFAIKYGAEKIRYVEAEAAFDMSYAQTMGMPKGVKYVEEIHTVEDFDADLSKWLADQEGPNLYILDSLDALSSDAEMDRESGEPTYGTEKAKALSALFRKRTADLRAKMCTLIIISQIRDNIGVRFGETKKRSGGRALDFYASQIIWLAELKKLKRTVTKVERVVGVQVRCQCKKNKCGKPFREANVTILHNYGVDDETSMLDWIKENKAEELLPEPFVNYSKSIPAAKQHGDRKELGFLQEQLKRAVYTRWAEIDDALAPPMSKYE